jgi:Lectin C-type domain
MKAFSVLGWSVPLVLVLCYTAATAGVDVPVQNQDQDQDQDRGLAMKMRCKGKMNMRCPAPRRPSRPVKRPVKRPTFAPTSGDACVSSSRFPTTNHLYGVRRTGRGILWSDAQAAVAGMKPCCGVRPHLVSITSEEENEFVASLFARFNVQNPFAHTGLNNRNQSSAATFVWDGTNETVSYTNWCTPTNGDCITSQPDFGPDACMLLQGEPDLIGWYWYDYDCKTADPEFYLFEYDCPP